MKSLIVISLLCMSFVGCASDKEVLRINNSTLSGDGELVGTFKDGRELRRYEIYRSGTHNHFVYIVDNVVTINRTVNQGKTNSHKVDVFINGTKQ